MTKTERLAKQMLENEGFQVENIVKTKWHRKDFFNLWDLICVSAEKIRFVQVSTVYLSSGSHASKDYAGFVCPPWATKEFWRWDKKKKRFILFPTSVLSAWTKTATGKWKSGSLK